MIDRDAAYLALTSRDVRFDGIFYVGVTSTGIYCRPICPVKPPQAANCLFYSSAEAAEKSGFRPCLRCRPELAPGSAPVDKGTRIAERLMQQIDEGLIEQTENLEEIAARFDLSLRQLRRIVQKELGVSPHELRQTRRLLLAKQLLSETLIPVTEIAYASGFRSLRRFNDAFTHQYRMPPSHLRKVNREKAAGVGGCDTSVLQLGYRPPYDWPAMLDFLRLRALKGVEYVDELSYNRTVRLGQHVGWIKVWQKAEKNTLQVQFSHSLTPVLPLLLRRLRNLFDLSARPDVIEAHLAQDELLRPALAAHPGLRVPGAFDGVEMALRAILGQQITVKAAATLGGRLVAAFGEPVTMPLPQLTHLTPLSVTIAQSSVDEIASLGIVSARARCIRALAETCARGNINLDAASRPEKTVSLLLALPGIGEWTAQYLAMRALRWPDAFPAGDIVVRNRLGGIDAKEAERRSQAWRPWRSYAVMHIWKSLK